MRVVVTGRLEQRSWETEDGERRFKVEIVADEVGPGLRFATVDVHRVERHQGTATDAGSLGNGSTADDEAGGARKLTRCTVRSGCA